MAVADYMLAKELSETPEHARQAMDAIKQRDIVTHQDAQKLRGEADVLRAQAHQLDIEASLTFPLRR